MTEKGIHVLSSFSFLFFLIANVLLFVHSVQIAEWLLRGVLFL